MGLSNIQKDAISTFQVLTDIFDTLKSVDLAALKQAAKEAQELAKEARASTEKNQSILSEVKQSQAALGNLKKELEDRQKFLEAKGRAFESLDADLNKKQNDLNAKATQYNKDAAALTAAQEKLKADTASLEKDRQLLNDRQKQIAEYENGLKATAEKLKGITEGL